MCEGCVCVKFVRKECARLEFKCAKFVSMEYITWGMLSANCMHVELVSTEWVNSESVSATFVGT